MGADVADDFAAAHREADECRVAQVEVLEQRGEVGCEGVVVVAVPGLRRRAEAATVVRDHPMTGVDQRRDLVLPRTPAERPTVDEDHRLAGAVVLVVELHIAAVLGAYSQSRHGSSLPGSRVASCPANYFIDSARGAARANTCGATWLVGASVCG